MGSAERSSTQKRRVPRNCGDPALLQAAVRQQLFRQRLESGLQWRPRFGGDLGFTVSVGAWGGGLDGLFAA